MMVSTCLFLFLSLTWNNKTWVNIIFKMFIICLTVLGILLNLQYYEIITIYDN
jgi:hypothetical protein